MSHYGSQVVEITRAGYKLNKARGFLEIHDGTQKIGQIPFDDIATVIISTLGSTISTALIDYLCRHNIPLVICGNNFLPCSMTLPLQGHTSQFRIMQAQIHLTEPRRKQAWRHIIKSKIRNQASVLEQVGQNYKDILAMSERVKSGDPENYEAQAARIYWPRLFGADFRRDQEALGINTILNYTYAIVRACVARGLCGAGLHPAFSIHHKNPRNSFNLTDDFIEPFRPVADMLAWQATHGKRDRELTPSLKSRLAAITELQIPIGDKISPLSLASVRMSRSFARFCQREQNAFCLPSLPTAIEMASL